MKSSLRAAGGKGSVRFPALIKFPRVIRITVIMENALGVRAREDSFWQVAPFVMVQEIALIAWVRVNADSVTEEGK
jgi:hypothetical protein